MVPPGGDPHHATDGPEDALSARHRRRPTALAPAADVPLPLPAPSLAAALLLAALLAAGCGRPSAMGEANSLILAVPDDSLWRAVEDTTYAVLEPTVFTVREEKKYYVEPVDTASANWETLRTFRHVVVLGTPENRWVRRVVDASPERGPPRPGRIYQADDVWANGQLVTAVVVDPERPAASWVERLPELLSRVEAAYRDFVARRMFASGPDSAAADSLRERFGFRLTVPRVYDLALHGDSVVVVRNDNPRPSDLIRSVLVAWRPPVAELTAELAYEWRRAVGRVFYNVPQEIDTSAGRVTRLEVAGRPALEATGTWRDVGGAVPAGGPFVARLVRCPDRTFFLDGWVYAPGKDKYQYVLQIRTILGSFSCGPGDGG